MSTKVATAVTDNNSSSSSNLNNTKETNGSATPARRLRTRNSTGSGVGGGGVGAGGGASGSSGNTSGGNDSGKKNNDRNNASSAGAGGGGATTGGGGGAGSTNSLSDSNSNATGGSNGNSENKTSATAAEEKAKAADTSSTVTGNGVTSSSGTNATNASGGANASSTGSTNSTSGGGGSSGGGGGSTSTKKASYPYTGPGGPLSTRKDYAAQQQQQQQPKPAPRSSSTFNIAKNEEFHFDTPKECPVFRPTPEEFKNPLAFISKIRPIAEKCGIAKILPPPSWSPPFAVDVDKLKFTPRVQRLNELEAKTRVKLNFLDQIAKFWELQGSSLKIPMVERKALDLYTLHRIVQEEGGMEQTTKDRKWARVANRMNYPSSKSVGATLKAHYERILLPFEIYTSGKVLAVAAAAAAANAANSPDVAEKVKLEDGTDYKTHEIPTRQQITPPNENNARRSKRFANSSANCGFGGAVRNGGIKTESKEDVKRDLISSFNNANAVVAKIKSENSNASGGVGGVVGAGAAAGASAAATKIKDQKEKKVSLDPNCIIDPLMKYICHICNRGDAEESMLLCDGCDDSYHTFCLLPPLTSIPKGEWLCPRCVVEEVSKPTEAFGFEQADREYTLQEFGQMADHFKMEYFQMPVHIVPTTMVEREFWRIVSSIDEDVTVEYGADLHTMDHGSGFPTKSSLYLLPSDQEYAESSWNLNNLPLLEDSILGHINADISGMNAPWMYVGMCFAAFCWHNEDHWSYSINYLHWGEPKTWYGVPGSCAEQFEETMKQAAPELFATQPDLLHQLVTIMNPNILMNNDVPVYRTDQNAGEFVITFPRAYHAGFNQGYNFAEAVNFAPADWLKMGRECINHYSMLRRFCVFSHDELVCKMALEPAKLTFGIATACYIDMAEMVDSEKKLRKSLLEWGVTRAERKAFELIPDDKRHCHECNTTCFLSAVACECTKSIVCLRHYTVLCSCQPEKHTLLYRYTLDEMPLMLQKLKAKAQSFERWLSRCRDIVDASTPTSVTLPELQELCKEAEVKKFPSSLLIDRLNAAVLEAEKCVTVIQQLGINKVRTRSDNSMEAAQYKLTMEELELFVQEIDNLCCIIEEGASVRELLVLGKSFVERATAMLKQSLDKAEEIEMEALINEGNSLRIELHQIPSLQIRLKQCKWYKRANGLRNSNTKLSYADIKTLLSLAESEVAPNDALVEKEVKKLHEIGASIETWEERAEKYFKKTVNQHELLEIEEFLKTAININGQVPSYGTLKDALRKARDWLRSVEQLQANDHYPYCHTLEDIIKRGSSIQIKLDELSKMQEHVKSAKEWKRSTEMAFLKPNSCYHLLEVLLPRSDAVNIDSDLKKPFRDEFLKDMNPSQIVESFKLAEDKELKDMRELRRNNMTKNPLRDKYCLCKSSFNGLMHNCRLCRDWFHDSCVPTPEPDFFAIHGISTKSKWLCPSCIRSKRPRLETILPLLVSLQRLPIRLPEDEALRCLAERAMNWQDRARKALTSPDVTAALEAIANHNRKQQQKRKNICATLNGGASSNSRASPDGSTTSTGTATGTGIGTGNGTTRKLRRSSQQNSKDAASSDDDDEGRLRIVEDPLSNDEDDSVPSQNNKDVVGQQQNQNQNQNQNPAAVAAAAVDENTNDHQAAAALNDVSSDGLADGGTGNGSENELQMLLSTSETENLDELMMEGDLLEVSLDETQELWRLLAMVQAPICTEAAALVEQHKQKTSKRNASQLTINANSNAEDSNDSILVQSSPNSNSTSSLSGRTSAGGSKKRRSLDQNNGAVPRKKTATPNKHPTSSKKSSRKSDLGKQQQQDDNAENFTPTKQTNGNSSSSAASQKKRKRMAAGNGNGSGNHSSGGGNHNSSSGNQQKKNSQQRTQIAQQEDDEEEECRADICYKPTGREVDWVQCDGGCNEWFHMFCVGLIRSQVKSDDDYYCMRCKKNDTPSSASTAHKTSNTTAKGRTQAAR